MRKRKLDTGSHYVNVIGDLGKGLIILRYPLEMRQRDFDKIMTALARQYGKQRKDIWELAAIVCLPSEVESEPIYAKEREEVLPKLERAFAGDRDRFKGFDLWDVVDGNLVQVRRNT